MPKVVGFDPKLVNRCTCQKCSAIIEYTDNEVRTFSYRDISGCAEIACEIMCPNCGSLVQWDK